MSLFVRHEARFRSRLAVGPFALLVALTLEPVPAAAQSAPFRTEEAVEWRDEWPRFRAWEYAVTGASLAGLGAIVLFAGRPDTAPEYGNPFDDVVRRALRAETRAGRDSARTVSDIGFRFLNVYPYVDSLIVAGLVHWNGDVALQTFLIDTEAFAIAGFVSIGFERLVGRARPSARECVEDPQYESNCGEADRYSSLLSGHTAIAFAGAGLTCVHHMHLPLYGARTADVGACLAATGVAIVSGAGRAINDRHWGSDLVFAAGIGTFAGLVMPLWLHYGMTPRQGSASPRDGGLRLAIFPELDDGRAALRVLAVH